MPIITTVIAIHKQNTKRKSRKRMIEMNKLGFEVKLPEKQIVLTKDFARKVSDITSPEHDTFLQLRASYPTFTVVKYTINQKVGREHYGKLSYENIAILIAEWEKDNPAALEELEQKKREAKCYAGSYGILKKWFLVKYGKQYAVFKANQNAN